MNRRNSPRPASAKLARRFCHPRNLPPLCRTTGRANRLGPEAWEHTELGGRFYKRFPPSHQERTATHIVSSSAGTGAADDQSACDNWGTNRTHGESVLYIPQRFACGGIKTENAMCVAAANEFVASFAVENAGNRIRGNRAFTWRFPTQAHPCSY